ncbi:MAG: SET domain-containing protein [Ilumatobacteraceae bacterium]
MLPPAAVRVDPRIEVRPSTIAGQGLFATAPIEPGMIVLGLGGRLVTTSELDEMFARAAAEPDAAYIDTFSAFDDMHIVLPPSTAAHFCNHSCDPNLWMEGPFDIATRRSISVGDELTIDYGTISGAPGFEMPCTCGTPSCRMSITSDDWQRPDLQRRYGSHWVPVLRDRIHASRG